MDDYVSSLIRKKISFQKSPTFAGVFSPQDVGEPDYNYLKLIMPVSKQKEFIDFVTNTILVSVIEDDQKLVGDKDFVYKQFTAKGTTTPIKYFWDDENLPLDKIFVNSTQQAVNTMFHCSWGSVVSSHKASWEKHSRALIFPARAVVEKIYRFTPLDTMVIGKIPRQLCKIIQVAKKSNRVPEYLSEGIDDLVIQSSKTSIRAAVDEFVQSNYVGMNRFIPVGLYKLTSRANLSVISFGELNWHPLTFSFNDQKNLANFHGCIFHRTILSQVFHQIG
jgi:hypothetical protein